MKFSKKVSVGKFLKRGEDFKDGDTAIIANEGSQEKGDYGIQNLFLIQVNGKEGNVNFNQTSLNTLIDGYGEDSIKWIGKPVKIMMIKQMVSNKLTSVYYFFHPDTILDEKSGQFILKGKSVEEMPDEVNPEEVPFN